MHSPVIGIVIILLLGIGSEWLAWRIHAPSILILLIFGFVAGPVTHLLNPDLLFGSLLFPIVSLSVAIILFEGGLSLRLSELRRVGTVIRNMVTIGIGITWVLSTAGAMFFLKMDFGLALLTGAILTVTGPTVIAPLLRHLRVSGRIGPILKWESMVNDPIGAILAVLVFEAIMAGGFQQATNAALSGLFRTLLIGSSMGLLGSSVLGWLLKRYLIPDFLQSAVTLMMVSTVFVASNFFQSESGLVAVTILGIHLGNQKGIALRPILEFKENLRVLLISGLFIILAARLERQYLAIIGMSSVAFFLFLVLVVRPASIFCSAIRTDLKMKEKLFLSWMAPRGIVAAAVASIFALELERAGYPNAEKLVAVIFFVIVTTVALYGGTAQWIARLLKIAQPNPQGILMLGAHPWAQKIAAALKQEGYRILMTDMNWFHVQNARAAGLTAVHGDVMSEQLMNELDLEGIGRFVALTGNDEVNSLAALHFEGIFGRSDIYQLASSRKEKDQSDAVSPRLHGRFIFGPGVTFDYLGHLFQKGGVLRKIALTKEYDFKAFRNEFADKALPLFLISDTGQLKVMTANDPPAPKVGQSILALVPESP